MALAQLQAVIDGASCTFVAGTTVLQALRARGVDLPTLCHDDRLAPVGQCWSCAVEFAAGPGLPFHNRPACREPLRDGCEVRSGGAWTPLPRTEYNYFLSEQGGGCGGALRITDIYGEQLTVEGLPVRPDVVQRTGAQFAAR